MSSENRNRFEQAINVISTRIKLILLQLSEQQTDNIQEIRLRTNKPVIIVNEKGCSFLTDKGKLTKIYNENCVKTSPQEITDTLNRACNYSIHSFQQSINNGFITIAGGHRIGVAGTAIAFDDESFNVKDIGFLNIRVSRQVFGVSERICHYLFQNNVKNIIIAGPPSSGKTTFLRDFAYRISSGFTGEYIKTVVLDERGEFSAPYLGVIQNDLGLNTDVLINYKKSHGVELALRSLSPEYIIFDEICNETDLSAVKNGLNSGVKFAVSVHCGNENDLKNKMIVNELIKTDEFHYIILLSGVPHPCSIKNIFRIEVKGNETIWTDINNSLFGFDGNERTEPNEEKNYNSSSISSIA